MFGGSKGTHDEGCHVCGGFPGSLNKPVNTLYQCTSCGFFTCNHHTTLESMKRACPGCRSTSLKVAMSESAIKRMKKGGLPGGAKTSREATKTVIKKQEIEAKKKKGYTPLGGGGGGGGMFGGKGIFGKGEDDVSDTQKDGPNIKRKEENKKDAVEVEYDKEGKLQIRSIKQDKTKQDGRGVSFKINVKSGPKGAINVSVTDDEDSDGTERLTGHYYKLDKQSKKSNKEDFAKSLEEAQRTELDASLKKVLQKLLDKERKKYDPEAEGVRLNIKSNNDKQDTSVDGKGEVGVVISSNSKESIGAKQAGGGQKVGLERGDDINIDITGYAPVQLGAERHGKSSHMTLDASVGKDMNATTDLKAGGKDAKGGRSDFDQEEEGNGSNENNDEPSLLSEEPLTDYIGTHATGDMQGTPEVSEVDIDEILDAVLEDEDLALMLLDNIQDDHLRQMAEDYINDANNGEGDEDGIEGGDGEGTGTGEDNEEEGGISSSGGYRPAEETGANRQSKEQQLLARKKKKSALLKEFAKSLQPKAEAKNYRKEQAFEELQKTLDVYEEHPNEETKPKWLHPTLADAFFQPSIEGLASMKKHLDEVYSLESKGDEKTVSIVQFDLGTSAPQHYTELLNEKSLVLGATAYGSRSVARFDEEKLITALTEIPGIVAVAVGLDNHFSPQTIDKQKEVFKKQILIAQEMRFPVLISSEKAEKEIISIFAEMDDELTIPLIYASPINTPEILELCQERGMYIAIRSEITFDSYKDTYAEYIKEIPQEKWLLASGSEFSVPQGKKEATVTGSNPLIPEVAPEINKEGHMLVMDTSSFIGGVTKSQKSIAEASAKNQETRWNKPELIRTTRRFLVQHLHKQHTHPFYKQLIENFIYVFSGEAAKDILVSLDQEAIRQREEERKAKEEAERKVLIIKAEE